MKTNSSCLVPFPEARVQCYRLSEDKANPFIHCSIQMQSETIRPHLLTSLNRTSFSMYSEHGTQFGRELQAFIPCPVNHYRPGDESLTDKAVFPLRRQPNPRRAMAISILGPGRPAATNSVLIYTFLRNHSGTNPPFPAGLQLPFTSKFSHLKKTCHYV